MRRCVVAVRVSFAGTSLLGGVAWAADPTPEEQRAAIERMYTLNFKRAPLADPSEPYTKPGLVPSVPGSGKLPG